MKKILKSIVILAAALSVAPMLSAQNITEPYRIDNGIAFKKSVSPKPDPETGEYTVKIETFVTGEVATRQKAIPSDIILVLDVSGSMEDNMYSSYTYSLANNQSYAYNTAFGENSARYILYEGEYYQVCHGRHYNPGYYYLFFTVDGVKKYLSGTSIVDEVPTNYTRNNTTIWNNRLYQRTGQTSIGTKMDVLKSAVKNFITTVTEKDSELELETGQIGNQISIIKFAGDPTDEIGDDMYVGGYDWGSPYYYNYTQVVKPLTPVANNSSALKNAVDGLEPGGATCVHHGLEKARDLLKSLNSTLPTTVDGEPVRSRTVVVFTDGSPTTSNSFEYPVAKEAIDYAADIKATSGDNAGYANVFTIGVFSTKHELTDDYMDYMSSNYPDGSATYITNNGNRVGLTFSGHKNSDYIFYQDASNEDADLDAVFQTIASHSSGQNTSVGDESLLTLDIVSSSFSVPEGSDLSKVKVYTAQCLGELNETYTDERGQVHNYLAFAAPVEAKNRPAIAHLWCRRLTTDADGREPGTEGYEETYEWYDKGASVTGGLDIDQNIEKDKSETDNSVSTTGFNFSDYWCGYDENDAARGDNKNTEQYTSSDPNYQYHKPGFRGFKLILEFPITFNDDAVGGPSVKTNEPGSGIYLTDPETHEKIGNPLVTFNQPQVETPVNLWVKKYGLNKGESATFGIYRKPVSGSNPAWEETPFTTIVITGTGEMEGTRLVSPVYKMNGLSPAYYYKVVEQGWSWSYDKVASEDDTDTSTETLLVNPVRITDQKRDTNVKHAESKAINIFGNGYETKTIDSREFLKPSSSNDNGSSTEGGSN